MNQTKLEPGLVASSDLRPGNGTGLCCSWYNLMFIIRVGLLV